MGLPLSSITRLVARNLYVHDRRTSVKLEPEMWTIFQEIAHEEGVTIHDLTAAIAETKLPSASLTGAIRVFIVLYLRSISHFKSSPFTLIGPEGSDKSNKPRSF